MAELTLITKIEDIPSIYRNTPIQKLIEYHNMEKSLDVYDKAELLVGMCMDNRKHLHIPDNFAYIIRSGGANLRHSEFKVSYALSVGGVKAIALIGHNHCAMEGLINRKEGFVEGLIENAGWDKKTAEEHFNNYAPLFEIGSAEEFILTEAARLRARYPKILVAAMYYKLEDNMLYFLEEKN